MDDMNRIRAMEPRDMDAVVALWLAASILAHPFVAPEAQGRGIGTALMEFSKNSHPSIGLAVYSANARAVEFYKRYGFTSLCEQVDEQTGQPETIMEYKP